MLEHAVDGALVLALLDGLALVVLTLASCGCDDQLGKATLVDEEAQGDDGDTGLLGVAGDAAYFLAVEQQLAVTMGSVVVIGTVTVLGNVHVLDPNLTIDDHTIGIGQAALALTDGLDFGAREHNARSERLDNLIVERRLAVFDIDCIVIVVSCHRKGKLLDNKQVFHDGLQQ